MFSYRLAERLGMIRSEMLERMSAFEFQEWLALARIDYAASAPAETPSQTPQQMLDMLTPGRSKRKKHG